MMFMSFSSINYIQLNNSTKISEMKLASFYVCTTLDQARKSILFIGDVSKNFMPLIESINSNLIEISSL